MTGRAVSAFFTKSRSLTAYEEKTGTRQRDEYPSVRIPCIDTACSGGSSNLQMLLRNHYPNADNDNCCLVIL